MLPWRNILETLLDSGARESDRGAALAHAWAWFELHSKQRMQTINFFLVFAGAILAGAAAALKEQQYVFLLALGAALALVSLLFFFLDERAKRLVRIGEAALQIEQEHLARKFGSWSLNFIRRSAVSGFSVSYGRIFRVMFAVSGLTGLGLSGYAVSVLLTKTG